MTTLHDQEEVIVAEIMDAIYDCDTITSRDIRWGLEMSGCWYRPLLRQVKVVLYQLEDLGMIQLKGHSKTNWTLGPNLKRFPNYDTHLNNQLAWDYHRKNPRRFEPPKLRIERLTQLI